MFKKIIVVGAGYVGTSLAVLLSQKNKVILIDNNKDKINLFKDKKSPIKDKLIQDFIDHKKLNLKMHSDLNKNLNHSDLIILCLPTNYDDKSDSFDTGVLENVIFEISKNHNKAPILIKSTVPIGFTKKMNQKYSNLEIIFSPEFLREGRALIDNIEPSRIIIGSKSNTAIKIANLFLAETKNQPKVFMMNSSDAEAVKLFSNSFLALRVSFFNELDSFCLTNSLDPRNIIEGVCSDPRIGNTYNNPSFGYGGYCLPKDTKQLISNFANTPQKIFDAVVDSNILRKQFIVEKILEKKPSCVGVYRLIMKQGSDNFRESAIFDVIDNLKKNDIRVLIYEPLIDDLNDYEITNSIDFLNNNSDIIISNRRPNENELLESNIFTRDIFGNN